MAKSSRQEPVDPPEFLPPRRPSASSRRTSPPNSRPGSSDGPSSNLNPQSPNRTPAEHVPALSRTHATDSRRPQSLRTPSARHSFEASGSGSLSRASSQRDASGISRRSSLNTLHEHERSPVLGGTDEGLPGLPPASLLIPRRQPVARHSSLRHETRPSDESLVAPSYELDALPHASSESAARKGKGRPKSHPQSKPLVDGHYANHTHDIRSPPACPDNWALPPLIAPMLSRPPSRPEFTFKRLSSLDEMLTYREDRQSWKRESSIHAAKSQAPSLFEEAVPDSSAQHPDVAADPPPAAGFRDRFPANAPPAADFREGLPATPSSPIHQHASLPHPYKTRFRNRLTEYGFCFTIAMTQLLAEYLISGFALILPSLFSSDPSSPSSSSTSTTGMFWPAALLSLILSATLLTWARISDAHGGYYPFMAGLLWLTLWTLIPGFFPRGVLLDISRAMQGLAIAAFTPSTFSMVGSIYPEGRRRNFVLGLYGACAPLGFYIGFLTAGGLPEGKGEWYFWIAAALSGGTLVTAYLSVPADRTDRKQLGLSMDWLGAGLITSGLVLVAYALAVEPYTQAEGSGFAVPGVWAPLVSGVVCLVVAVWVEVKVAACPLLPARFFAPQGVKWFCVACLFFYAAYGVWLYNSAEYFTNDLAVPHKIKDITLSLWYTPMAIGGIVFCVIGSALIHIIPTKLLLALSGLAWVGAPLVFAISPVPLDYWTEVMPGMLCSTIGLDLTFTISTIFLSSVQPLQFQGIAGAVSSVLINLAMSFSLPISSIVKEAARARYGGGGMEGSPEAEVYGFRAAFVYGAASAGVGLAICVFLVRISRDAMRPRKEPIDEEAVPRATSSEAPTLVNHF